MMNNSPSISRFRFSRSRSYVGIAFCIVIALMALPLFIGSAVSPSNPTIINEKLSSSTAADVHQGIAAPAFNFRAPLPQAAPVTLDTFAGDCTTAKDTYNLQDTDKTVCAKFTNASPGWQVIWSNAKFVAVQTSAVTAANGSASFT